MLNLKEVSELVSNKIKKLESRLQMFEGTDDEDTASGSSADESERSLDSEANFNIITDLIQEARERKGKKMLTKKELLAIEFLQMNYKILGNEFNSLKEDNAAL